jgi:BirA family biotin operon repressor/biotin-[acetyl-CoA-carboxylase] ligase
VKPAAAAGPGARLVGGTVHLRAEVESTQDELARLAVAGAPEGTVVVADHQTGGRGRRGRTWWDAPGDNLLASVLLRPPLRIAEAPPLSLVAAIAVSEALETQTGVVAGIRWPNDLLVAGRKLCGVLAEAAAAADGRVDHVLLGIGVNANQTEFPAPIRALATSLRLLTGRVADREELLQHVLAALDRRYGEFLAGGFPALRPEWRRRSITPGRSVVAPDGRRMIAEDVADDGALLVRDETGRLLRLASGEIDGAPAA